MHYRNNALGSAMQPPREPNTNRPAFILCTNLHTRNKMLVNVAAIVRAHQTTVEDATMVHTNDPSTDNAVCTKLVLLDGDFSIVETVHQLAGLIDDATR